jgi:anaphase-promoting complex subunit 1
MFLKSGRADVSATIRLPQNPYDLDHIRPDLLLIRTLAINMIHWEDVRPTQEWVESRVPSFVSSAWETQRQGGSIDETVRLAYYHIVAGCCFTLGLKYASTINETAHGVLLKYFGVFLNAAAVGCEYRQHHLDDT